jgi:hypothetical protein
MLTIRFVAGMSRGAGGLAGLVDHRRHRGVGASLAGARDAGDGAQRLST